MLTWHEELDQAADFLAYSVEKAEIRDRIVAKLRTASVSEVKIEAFLEAHDLDVD